MPLQSLLRTQESSKDSLKCRLSGLTSVQEEIRIYLERQLRRTLFLISLRMLELPNQPRKTCFLGVPRV